MNPTKQFKFWYDFESDSMHVKCTDFDGKTAEASFSKEYLEDITAHKWYNLLDNMMLTGVQPKPQIKPNEKKLKQLAELMQPGIRYEWKKETNGHANIEYDSAAGCFEIAFSQGFQVQAHLTFESDDDYKIMLTLVRSLAQAYMHGNCPEGTKLITVPWGNEVLHFSITWKPLNQAVAKVDQFLHAQAEIQKQAMQNQLMAMSPQQGFASLQNQISDQQAMLQKLMGGMGQGLGQLGGGLGQLGGQLGQGMLAQQAPAPSSAAMTKLLEMQAQMAQGLGSMPSAKPVRELHVYDLGDGMLVPCEMMAELKHMFEAPQPSIAQQQMQWATQYLNDFVAAPPKVAKPAVSKLEKTAMHAALYGMGLHHIKDEKVSLYPGKVFLLDDPKHVEVIPNPYLTDKSAWFIKEDDASNSFFGESVTETMAKIIEKITGVQNVQTGVAQDVVIPKTPKQITKASLEYFHKLLGGKKNPF